VLISLAHFVICFTRWFATYSVYLIVVAYFSMLSLVLPLAFAHFTCSVCFVTYSCLLVLFLPPILLLASLPILSLTSALVTFMGISLTCSSFTFACFVAYLPTLLFSCLSFKLAPLAWCFLPSLFVQEVEHKRHDNPTF
jgi:hypothetical protein